jgi:hypothetical protein
VEMGGIRHVPGGAEKGPANPVTEALLGLEPRLRFDHVREGGIKEKRQGRFRCTLPLERLAADMSNGCGDRI